MDHTVYVDEAPSGEGHKILEEECIWETRQLPENKTQGIDKISSELLKAVPVSAITNLCQKIWETGIWAEEWKRSIFIPILKKGDSKDCSNYRTIALILHASKILRKIIPYRLMPNAELTGYT